MPTRGLASGRNVAVARQSASGRAPASGRQSLIGRWGIVSVWNFDGDGSDSFGANDLSNTNDATFAAGKISQATNLVKASSQFWSIADNEQVSSGAVDFGITAWVNMPTLPVVGENFPIASKWGSSANREYQLSCNNVAGSVRFFAEWTNSGVSIIANTFGAPTAGSWHFVMFVHDASQNLVGISIDGGPFDTMNPNGAGVNGITSFSIGRLSGVSGAFFNGLVDQVVMFKPTISGLIAGAEVRDFLYNSGSGRMFP